MLFGYVVSVGVFPFVCLSHCLCTSVCASVSVVFCLHLFVFLSFSLSVSVSVSVCRLSVCLRGCLYLSVCLLASCLFYCMSLSQSRHHDLRGRLEVIQQFSACPSVRRVSFFFFNESQETNFYGVAYYLILLNTLKLYPFCEYAFVFRYSYKRHYMASVC